MYFYSGEVHNNGLRSVFGWLVTHLLNQLSVHSTVYREIEVNNINSDFQAQFETNVIILWDATFSYALW